MLSKLPLANNNFFTGNKFSWLFENSIFPQIHFTLTIFLLSSSIAALFKSKKLYRGESKTATAVVLTEITIIETLGSTIKKVEKTTKAKE